MKRLLDTNVYVALKRGNPAAEEVVRTSSQVSISTIVLGELLFGFRNGRRLTKNLSELDEFLADARVELVDVTATTADRFGRIAAALRKSRKPIPTNDIWVAAHAFETGAELVTFDGHFAAIPGLVWTQLS